MISQLRLAYPGFSCIKGVRPIYQFYTLASISDPIVTVEILVPKDLLQVESCFDLILPFVAWHEEPSHAIREPLRIVLQ